MSRWDSLGTSKIQTPPKVEAPHGMKNYVNKICVQGLKSPYDGRLTFLEQKSKQTADI